MSCIDIFLSEGVFRDAIKLIAGILMVIIGINMLGIFQIMRRFQLRLFKGIAYKLYKNAVQLFVVELLNGLMPCGLLQSMQILALASGNGSI